MKTEARTCPLCKSPAVFYFIDHSDKRYYDCPTCSRFSISKTAETRIGEVSQETLSDLSRLAQRAIEGEVLSITRSSYDEMNRGIAVIGKLVPKTSLPL
jgi:hypothetical protein